MPENSQKTPASRMVRVSSPLIPYVQKLSDLHREGHTEVIIEGLTTLISSIENDIAASYVDSGVIADIIRRLEALEAAACSTKHPEPEPEQPITQPKPEPTQAPTKQPKTKTAQAPAKKSKPQSRRLDVEPSVEPRVEEKLIPRLPRLFCPKCNSTDLKRWGKSQDGTRQRYKCSNCAKQFFK
jgi:hypothetical protein